MLINKPVSLDISFCYLKTLCLAYEHIIKKAVLILVLGVEDVKHPVYLRVAFVHMVFVRRTKFRLLTSRCYLVWMHGFLFVLNNFKSLPFLKHLLA